LLEQLFLLQLKQWRKAGKFTNPADEEAMGFSAEQILVIFTDYNRRAHLLHYHKEILRSWVQVMRVALQGCDFEATARTSFILQTFQVILPKLEVSYNSDISTALQLASLAEALIQKMEFDAPASEKARTGDFANDRLSQLFRAALAGIYCPVTTTELREYCYRIAFRYIHGTIAKATKGSALGRNTLNTVKNCGSHLLEVVCDDAYSGQGTCKLSALLLLTALVTVATRQESKYILESFVALNFIGVLVDNIKHIRKELAAATSAQIPTLLSYYDASLALLLRICQTRVGAAYVLNAGLFPAVRESGIFSVDADIGLGFDDADALKKYYDLMLAVLRVINAAVISRGRQNEQTIFQAREFLKQNRNSVVAIFKRSVNVGVGKDKDEDLTDLVDCFTVLVDFTDFLQVCGSLIEHWG
jgi:nuclear pore complex protein Nup205